ncbi:5'-3' exoribonuclease [Fadolivirus algeromassiliense]|jgi:5'-3' exonuclease|uniref:5'-3' exoribonuclease n=1 Tax=Fadolivirus FV1/VV64 TaxID=3070911 RepID=A0A7D3UPW3_9VIRU|nr:5'-3' exoribonuclease [Fadolivirus algeromassiliense]QKF94188.1 5'-3' exoribonuclease [Fadolivirus FV1/VV64]
MGIERFFSSIEQNNITNLDDNFTHKLEKKLDTDILLIDFNSIVHITSSAIIGDLNYILYQIINKSYKNNQKVIQLFKTYKIKLNIDDDLNYEDYLELLNTESLNEIILNKVKDFLINILINFVESKKLKCLYIAVDGVPHKSKMLEQKKRRYMGTIINDLKSKIFNKYENELMDNKNRYLFEKNKISWSKIYISPGTPFMEMLNKLLSGSFNKEVKLLCPRLKDYIFSGSDEFGEGEKKIIDYAYMNNHYNNVTVYSPDSDMTLLCLILSNKVPNIKILRHNQQENNYDIIDIDKLKHNIFNYIINSIKIDYKQDTVKLDIISVISDIVFILTIFGNDFLPKIESFNVKYDFDKIIDKYIKMLVENKYSYIIQFNKVNQKSLLQIIRILHYDEGGNLQKTYMASHYQNYDKLKKIIGTNQSDFTKDILEFLDKLRKLNEEIKDNNIDISKWIADESNFISKLIKLTKLENQYKPEIDHYEFIDNYVKYYKKHNQFPEVRVTFRRYSKSLKNPHHTTKLEKSLDHLDPNLKPVKYDEEIYKLDNMLDEYVKKLNATSLNLGYVAIDPNTYIWKTEKVEKGVMRYYFDFFGINDINIKNPELSKIVSEYIEGVVWVFDYYFNLKFNKNKIVNNPDIWYYKHTHAPLLTQIYQYLKNQSNEYLDKLQNNLHKYKVKESEYFKPQEHLMYVSPINSYKEIIPKEYKNKKINSINIDSIVNEVWNNNVSDEVDCRGILFLNKCHVNEIHTDIDVMESWKNDQIFIKNLRN